MTRTRWGAPLGAVVAVTALAACGSGEAGTNQVAVTASESECSLAKSKLPAGSHTFSIKNTGSKVTEFEVLRPDGRIVSERENIGPGTTATLTVELSAGTYQAACIPGMVGKGVRADLTVTGDSAQASRDPRLSAAVQSYREYVDQQVDHTITVTRKFVAAVKDGDPGRAKRLYAPSREGWERIEPVAESFGDIDPKVDLREADLQGDQEWTGWHRIEKALWQRGGTDDMAPYCDRLLADLDDLRERVGTAEITPTSMANGAKELLDEVATGKITGEEEAFSHTDLYDFEANVVGAEKAYRLLRPVVVERDQALAQRLDREFGDVLDALQPYRQGSGFVSYDTVSEAQRKQLSDRVNALAEPLSHLAAVVTR